MKGAKRYAELFGKNQQLGKLYAQVGSHARGRTFKLWVLPNEELIDKSIHIVKDAIEVYGVVSGQPGWTESYGWVHKGPWEKDFKNWVHSLELAQAEAQRTRQANTEEAEIKRNLKIKELLDNY